MLAFMQYRRLLCTCLTGLLLGQLAACTTWRAQPLPPQQFEAPAAGRQVHIVRVNGSEVTLEATRRSGDTLYGTPPRDYDTNTPATVVAIPLSDIRTIAVREADATKTVGLVLILAIGLAGGALALFALECARIGCGA